MAYQFQPYDVLQVKSQRNGEWLDFSTLRTVSEGERAVELVQTGKWEGETREFRVRRGFNQIVLSK